MAHQITALARKYAPWSISKASVAETCPSQFQHKYVHKTEQTSVPSVNRVGTVAHKVLELRIGGTAHEAAKQAALLETPLVHSELDDLRVLETPIDWFMRKWETFCKVNGVQKVLLEEEWGFTDEMKPTGFFDKDVFFRGKVDLGVITKDQELIVIDHKSGLAKDISKDQKFKRQLNSYAVMALANIQGLVGVRGGIHFLQGPEAKRIQWLPYLGAPEIARVYVPWLFNHLDFCAAHLEEPFVARPKLRWPCEWCSYQTSCAAFVEMQRGSQS